MRYDFSSSFLVIQPPATNFGEAWELLCTDLLSAEHGSNRICRVAPPDHGIDIYNHAALHAYQCKASERGAAGTIAPTKSVESLLSAVEHRSEAPWDYYTFCTNAPYSAAGLKLIKEKASELAIDQESIDFLGPEYWAELCGKFKELTRDRFYYRVTASEKEIIDALRNAGYYREYVEKFTKSIQCHDFSIVITNNRTPVEIEIPFSPDLTVKNYLDVAKQLLGVTLEWTNYPDVGTSAGTSLSVTIDQYPQTFSTKLGELPIQSGSPLQLWIKIVWRENIQKSAPSDEKVLMDFQEKRHFRSDRRTDLGLSLYKDLVVPRLMLGFQPLRDRERVTVQRHEALIQGLIWDSFRELRTRRHADKPVPDERELRSMGLYRRELSGVDKDVFRKLEDLLGKKLQGTDRLQIELFRSVEEPED